MNNSEQAGIAFYHEMWSDIRHGDSLDWRIMVVLIPVYTSLFAIVLHYGLEPTVLFVAIIVNSCLAWYGMWMIIRSYAKMLSAIINLKFVEKKLGFKERISQELDPPKDQDSFWNKFYRSRRFPLFVTYATLLLAVPVGVFILFENIYGILPILQFVSSLLFGFIGFLVGLLIWARLIDWTIQLQIDDYLENTMKPCTNCDENRIKVTEDKCVTCKNKG